MIYYSFYIKYLEFYKIINKKVVRYIPLRILIVIHGYNRIDIYRF